MKLLLLSFGKCQMLYYILLCLIFSVITCFNPDLTMEKRNYENVIPKPLFEEHALWKQGDIPLLNRKIFKGTRVTIAEHPYIASVRRLIVHYSVAAMLGKNLFVTVAHPLIDVPIDELNIVVGESYADRGATLLTVLLIIMHEDFDRYTMAADIALLRVYEDMQGRFSVKPVQLVNPKRSINRRRAFVTGWGRCDRTGRELCLPRSSKYTPGEKLDPMLRSVSFNLQMPNLYCEGYKRNSVHIQPGMMCVGTAREESKVTSCLAVPGAPLVVNGKLAGLQSWGYGCGYEDDLPLIYTSVQFYQPWLVHNIPILRLIQRENLTFLFEAKRANLLTKWLNLTRIIPPEPFGISDKPMEMKELDQQLANLRGHIIDIRDVLFDGMHRENKMRLYDKLRERKKEKASIDQLAAVISTPMRVPFLSVAADYEQEPEPNDTSEYIDTENYYEDYEDYSTKSISSRYVYFP